MYNLTEYADIIQNIGKFMTILQTIVIIYYLDNSNNIIDFPANNNSVSFKFKQNITKQTLNDGTKDVEIII